MRYAVVDGDQNADVYGYAKTWNHALDIARASFADQVSHVELYGPIQLRDGRTLPKAFVAFTVQP